MLGTIPRRYDAFVFAGETWALGPPHPAWSGEPEEPGILPPEE